MKPKYPYIRWKVVTDITPVDLIEQDNFYVTESELTDSIIGSVMNALRDGASKITITKINDRPEEYI